MVMIDQIQGMNRHQRRHYAKIMGLKNIASTNVDHIDIAKKKYEEKMKNRYAR